MRVVVVLVAALVAVVSSVAKTTESSNAFTQFNATRYLYSGQAPLANWPALPFSQPVQQVLWWDSADAFLFLFQEATPMLASVNPTNGELYGWRNWNNSVIPYLGVGAVGNGSFYYVALWGPELVVQRCLPNQTCFQMMSPDATSWINVSSVTDVAVIRDGELAIGTDTALIIATVSPHDLDLACVPLHNTQGVVNYTGHNVSKVHVRPDGTVYATTHEYYLTPNCWTTDLVHVVNGTTEVYFYRTPGIIDAIPTAFVEDPRRGALHMGNEICDNVLFENGTLQRVAGAFEGNLPQRNITCGVSNVQSGNVWFGTSYGVEVLQVDNTWKYFFGPRWMPAEGFTTGNAVRSLATASLATGTVGAAPVEVVVVATDSGISVVYTLQWRDLDAKAAYYQSNMPRFLRYGLVSQLSLQSFGDTLHFTQGTTANDGLWSSLYLGSQAFRFAVTGDATAQQEAWNTFEGMQMLINVTGDLGYPARSFVYQTPCPEGLHTSTSMPGYCWQGGTSSDEITGHLSAYPALYFLAATTDDQKARIAATITNILGGIVKNNFTLVGASSGKPTQWGHWGPQSLNDDPFWYDERGVNANQILSFLVTGYAITGNALFSDAFWTLVNDHRYDWNIVDLKITQPSDINYSDDELTFWPYVSFLLGARMADGTPNPLYQRIEKQVWRSIERTHGFVAKEKPSLYNAIFIGAAQLIANVPDSDTRIGAAAADGLWWLRTYTVWQVDWPINNMQRLDAVYPRNDVGRDGPGSGFDRTLTLFPYDEITMLRWNANPFATTQGSGYSELDPSPYLFGFWVGRYFRAW